MTEGSEAGHIVRFALPLLGGNLLQQTYNIVDTAIVGTFLGDSALAAVGATGYALVNGTAEVICRIGLSLVLTAIPVIGHWGIWLTTCCTWFVTAAVSLLRYKGGKWKSKSLVRS